MQTNNFLSGSGGVDFWVVWERRNLNLLNFIVKTLELYKSFYIVIIEE